MSDTNSNASGSNAPEARPADAVASSWVATMPATVQPYLRLARFDRPIGTWLLFWPCVWSTLLTQGKMPDWRQVLWFSLLFLIGATVMRGAGCAYNDIVDRDIDAKVARTRGRPLPSGQISVRQAWIFLGVLCLIGLAVLIQFNRPAIYVALGSLALVAIYPFMKRITWWPQAWLGLTFNWGALVGWMAVTGQLSFGALLVYAAGIFWTLGYDTIYAAQDIEDDALAGVKSSARAVGLSRIRQTVALFYGVTLVLLGAAFYCVQYSVLHLLFMLPVAGHFLLQIYRLDPADGRNCLTLFKSNRDAGALVALACLGCVLI
jgi:4-hydroxybenzoate polyprenyltransferase